MPDQAPSRCLLCQRNFYQPVRRDFDQGSYTFTCGSCREYVVSQEFLEDVGPTLEDSGLAPFLSAHVRQNYSPGNPVTISKSNWRVLAESHRHTSVNVNLDKLLRHIEASSPWPGAQVNCDLEVDWPVIDVPNKDSFAYFLAAAVELEYLHKNLPSYFILTTKGWEYLTAGGAAGIPGHAFVAMSYDQTLDEAYEQGIRAALEVDCGLTAIRVATRMCHLRKFATGSWLTFGGASSQ